jgi:hydroxyethylthiazole kinase-like sugar kinase family protein
MVDGIVRSVESRKQLLHPVVVDKVMWNIDSRKKKKILNPVVVDGNAKTVSNPVVVDGIVRKVDSRERYLNLRVVVEVVQNLNKMCER